jgi:predicted deacetylase
MNWVAWDAIESLLLKHDVRPILAVVPANLDPKLCIAPPCPDFWMRVRHWQSAGYAIGLHGYQHHYVNNASGLMRITARSEFARLPRNQQETKLRHALEIFSANGVNADLWVAPAHSFDRTTVDILADLGIMTISDGLWRYPHTDKRGVTWVPQQLWGFAPKRAGVWTVCCHHNTWTPDAIARLAENLEGYATRITDLATVLHAFTDRRETIVGHTAALWDWTWNHGLAPLRGDLRRAGRAVANLLP